MTAGVHALTHPDTVHILQELTATAESEVVRQEAALALDGCESYCWGLDH